MFLFISCDHLISFRLKTPGKPKREAVKPPPLNLEKDIIPEPFPDLKAEEQESCSSEGQQVKATDATDDQDCQNDIEEYQDEEGEEETEEEVQALQRSISLVNLKDLEEEETRLNASLPRVASQNNVNEVRQTMTDFLKETMEFKKGFLERQEAIDAEVKLIFLSFFKAGLKM